MLITIYVIFLYFVLLIITPRGTNLHEILHIPLFWWGNLRVKKNNYISKKVRFGKKWNQYYLFYRPKNNPVTKKHIILYFHGGGWMAGSPEMLKASAQLFANHGYISVFPNYRKAPFASINGMREDLTLCMETLQKELKALNLEDKKIILGGMSAGANLAALVSFQKEELEKINFDTNKISGLFLCGAPLDLSTMKWSFPLYFFAGKRNSEKFHLANPVQHFSKYENPPMFLFHGTKDGLVPYRNVISFLEKTKTKDSSKIKLHTIPKGTHMQTASWGYEDNELRKLIFDWLDKFEKNNLPSQ